MTQCWTFILDGMSFSWFSCFPNIQFHEMFFHRKYNFDNSFWSFNQKKSMKYRKLLNYIWSYFRFLVGLFYCFGVFFLWKIDLKSRIQIYKQNKTKKKKKKDHINYIWKKIFGWGNRKNDGWDGSIRKSN